MRWLRPEYQAKDEAKPVGKQSALEVDEDEVVPVPVADLQPWPKDLPDQAKALSAVLAGLLAPTTVEGIASRFKGNASTKRLGEVERLLETLAALGRVSKVEGAWKSAI